MQSVQKTKKCSNTETTVSKIMVNSETCIICILMLLQFHCCKHLTLILNFRFISFHLVLYLCNIYCSLVPETAICMFLQPTVQDSVTMACLLLVGCSLLPRQHATPL